MPKFEAILDEIDTCLETPDEDLDEEQRELMQKYLDELAQQETDKVDGFGRFLAMTKCRIEGAKAEAKRFTAKANAMQRRIDWLTARYAEAMLARGLKKIQGSAYSVSLRATQVCVVSDYADLTALPPEFVRVHPETREPNKIAMLKALKEGAVIPGVELGTRQSIVVR